MKYLKEIFIERREGRITLIGAFIYLSLWLCYKLTPSYLPIPSFYGMASIYVVFFLGLQYAKMGGFNTKKNFQSSAFNTGLLITILILPAIIAAKPLLIP